MKIKLEDIVFWILIAGIIAVALWLFHDSPPETSALIAIAIFIATSELLIWKKIFTMDKNTAVSFIRLKNDMNKDFTQIKNLIKEKWK